MATSVLEADEDYDLCIVGAYQENFSDRFGFMLEDLFSDTIHNGKIAQMGHTIQSQETDLVAHVKLAFDGRRDIDGENRNIARDFCRAVLNFESWGTLEQVSQYSILGFSAGNSDFGLMWNLIAIDAMVANGGEQLEMMHQRANKPSLERFAMWVNIASMVSQTALARCFRPDDFLTSGPFAKPGRTSPKIENLRKKAEDMCVPAAIEHLQELVIHKCALKPESERLQEANQAYNAFTLRSTQLIQRIRSSQGPVLSLPLQRKVLGDLFDLWKEVCLLYTATEELLQLYLRWVAELSVASMCESYFSVAHGVHAVAAFQAAGALTESAVAVMSNVPKENALTLVGRSVGLITSVTPQEIAAEQALALTEKATAMNVAGAANILFAGWHVYKAGKGGYAALKAFKKKEACRKINMHCENTAVLAMQVLTSMTWVRVVDGNVQFVGDARNDFERYLREKYRNNPSAAQLQPTAVAAELRSSAMWLERCGKQIKEEHEKLYG